MSKYRNLPDGNLLVHIPMLLKASSGGNRMVAVEKGANMDRNQEIPSIQMVATGLKYRREAITDKFSSRTKMAKHYGFDSSYLARVIRLGYLSPVIVNKLAKGELTHLSVQKLQSVLSPIWVVQHEQLGITD